MGRTELQRTTRDPLTVPPATRCIGDVEPRSRVVLTGIVVRADVVRWVGGPVLEVDLRDPTGTVTLAFFGRHHISGVTPGALVTAAGTVGRHAGQTTVLNPLVWVHGGQAEPFVAPRPSGTGVSLEQRVVAVALADQVGAVLAAPQPGERRHAHG